jgi:glycosyltransferase involved in cell wall biosynthesis
MNDLVLDLAEETEGLPRRLAEHLPAGARLLRLGELQRLGTLGVLRRLRREKAGTCVGLVTEFRRPGRWLALLLVVLAARAGTRVVMDREGATRTVGWRSLLLHELPFVLRRSRTTRRVCRDVLRGLTGLRPAGARRRVVPRRILYVRADVGAPLTGGGSLAHIHGVLSGFVRRGCEVRLLTPAPVSDLPGAIPTEVAPPDATYDLSVELPHLAYNATLESRCSALVEQWKPDLIYQRHALGCHAVAAVAQRAGIPLVLEYNGPEVWVARHWGAARRHLDLFAEIERHTLRAADQIVAVSSALAEAITAAGVPTERVLINPNGVDPDRFDPAKLRADRTEVRARLGVAEDAVLAVFVGTFGPWHGAEVLAEAVCRVPAQMFDLHFALVGDGPARARVGEILRVGGRLDRVTLTGRLGFDEIPRILAASDLCLSPHVPNPDGSAFFGSPTKLFEYMASGRAIVASELGQIGEVLDHGRNGWLVPPVRSTNIPGRHTWAASLRGWPGRTSRRCAREPLASLLEAVAHARGKRTAEACGSIRRAHPAPATGDPPAGVGSGSSASSEPGAWADGPARGALRALAGGRFPARSVVRRSGRAGARGRRRPSRTRGVRVRRDGEDPGRPLRPARIRRPRLDARAWRSGLASRLALRQALVRRCVLHRPRNRTG